MEFWHKKPFSIRFVHKSRKFSNFEPTVDYVMLRDFRTVRPIFQKIAPKVAQDFKEKKSWKLAVRKKNSAKLSREMLRGGADSAPPALLGLRKINHYNVCVTYTILLSIHLTLNLYQCIQLIWSMYHCICFA